MLNKQTDLPKKYWSIQDTLDLFALSFNDLLFQAATVHRQHFDPNEIQLSTLLSIKTGGCPENCKYCPQSAHYNTGVEKEQILDEEVVYQAAKRAKEAGASRFCMGAAWRSLHDRDVPKIEALVKKVKSLDLEVCVTLGMAEKDQLVKLKEAGLDYYNHNIDTSETFYDEIISTRDFDDRLRTLENIESANLNTCCGGIIGMGESIEDRANMLMTLANRAHPPRSVPINRLVKIKGTPLENAKDISDIDFVKMIAVARIMLPHSYVRLSAGRETMKHHQSTFCHPQV